MPPRLTSFTSVWNKVMRQNNIENAISPEKSVVPKRNPLSLSTPHSATSKTTSILPSYKQRSDERTESTQSQDGASTTSASICGSYDDTDAHMKLQGSLTLTSAIGTSTCDVKIPISAGVDPGVMLGDDAELLTAADRLDDRLDYGCSTPVQKIKQDCERDVKLTSSYDVFQEVKNSITKNIQQTRGQEINENFNQLVRHHRQNERVPDAINDPLEAGMFRVIIFTDTHLGHKESDSVRGNDPFNTFEEVLFLAKYLNVDAIFHSGDLFDESHPSRAVIYRTMDLIRRYCKKADDVNNGNRIGIQIPKSFAIRSAARRREALKVFDPPTPNETQLPFFVIHGNHDNPTTVNGLSPIDLLDVSGLVTFFGTATDMNKIEIQPILLNKGPVKVALYGLGWVKDECLYKVFEQGRVTFVPPQDTTQQYYKVLLFHQNRYPRRGKNACDYIPDQFLPDWLDLVIWGHEHECMKFPIRSETHNFQVLQMGSTVQTSLAAAEMAPKHCCIMELSMDDVKFYPITLETARQLHYSDLSLMQMDLPAGSPEKDVFAKLIMNIENVLQSMQSRNVTTLCSTEVAKIVLPNNATFDLKGPIDNAKRIPLVRMRVEHSGFDSVNPRTFGAYFVDRVANPTDILRFWQKHPIRNVKSDVSVSNTVSDLRNTVYPTMEESCHLKLLLERELNGAVERFAVGMETSAIGDYVSKAVREMQKALSGDMAVHYGDQISDEIYAELLERAVTERTNAARVAAGINRERDPSDGADDPGPMGISFQAAKAMMVNHKRGVHTDLDGISGPDGKDYDDRRLSEPLASMDVSEIDGGVGTASHLNYSMDTNSSVNLNDSFDLGSSMMNESNHMSDFIPQSPGRDTDGHNDKPESRTVEPPPDIPLMVNNFYQGRSFYKQTMPQSGNAPTVMKPDKYQVQNDMKRERWSNSNSSGYTTPRSFVGDAVKRACIQEVDHKVFAIDNGAQMPLDRLRENTKISIYEHADSVSRCDSPLGMSDFNDLALPQYSNGLNRAGDSKPMYTTGYTAASRKVETNITHEYRSTKEPKTTQRLATGKRSTISPERNSKNVADDSPDQSSDGAYSQGFRNTLISMFFKRK
ncbi:Double-strand break repair protein MRE11A [Babesia sp. Xinjiang]|uniref:Double-strand break repair protein MRE11A n=1 Tax=Babesia sp. Xinjiang TaxID=462227 RepID=UPI000A2559B4|nr:Double-strand break repair protein MRE11A [Babesia sp. Xinjiang]ORM40026.1 Double-strand break repair protein MRE11A [Babesia sp. Xinjiang]